MSSKRLRLAARIQHLIIALLLFTVLYTLTNHYSAAVFASYPGRIHTLAMALDESIAFMPVMIVPYSWSLILFVTSFFMVGSHKQLSQLTSRLILATLFACLLFYLFPARFSFVRSSPSDWTALGYQFLQLTDKPFNQLPSLHVSYALLLGYSLWNVTTEACRCRMIVFAYHLVLSVLCLLIIISTVLTYQHHLLDVLGGILLALVVLFMADKLHSKLVLKYLMVAIAGFLMIAISGFFIAQLTNVTWLETIGLIMAVYWLASFIALAYLYQVNDISVNKRWFKKNEKGQLTLLTRVSFAPLLLAYQMMSSLAQRYSCYQRYNNDKRSSQGGDQSDTQIASQIDSYRINETLSTIATPRLSSLKFRGDKFPFSQLIVIDVAAEISSHFHLAHRHFYQQTNAFSKRPSIHKLRLTTHYLYLPLLDLQPFKTTDIPIWLALFGQIDERVAHRQQRRNSNEPTQNHATLLNFHCVMGLSRSIAVEVLYLIYCDKLTVETYREWVICHYPKAHLSEKYLPLAVIKAMQKPH